MSCINAIDTVSLNQTSIDFRVDKLYYCRQATAELIQVTVDMVFYATTGVPSLKVARGSAILYPSGLNLIAFSLSVWNYNVLTYIFNHEVIYDLIRGKCKDYKLRRVTCSQYIAMTAEHDRGCACYGCTCLCKYSVVIVVSAKKHEGGCLSIKICSSRCILIYVCSGT